MLDWTMDKLSIFATDAERRDLVCIGASVGFAASFGAPIGGLLFILDDVSSYFERHLLLRMLVANAIGTFCLAMKHGDLSNYSIISMGKYVTPDNDIFTNRIAEVPLYILIGIGGGVLGGCFCAGYLWLRRNITSNFPPVGEGRAKWQLSEVAVVSIISSILLFYVPTVSWACKPIPDKESYDLDAFHGNITAAMEAYYAEQEQNGFFCPPGQINEMAKMCFGSRISAIRDIISDPSMYQQKTLITVGFVFYALTLITFGTSIPAGIFTPTVLIGAALGGACGNAFHDHVSEEINPSTFALLGVAALLAGVQHSTVSTAVILVEGTGQIKVLTPVIIVVIIARYIAHRICNRGIFEAVIWYKHLPYLEHENTSMDYCDTVEVKDIMSKPPLETLAPQERVGDLINVLNNSNHHGYPVVDSAGRFLGLVKRSQIAALLECGVFSIERTITREKDLAAAAYGIKVSVDSSISDGPLKYYAYTINDDRYDHLLRMPEEESPAEQRQMSIPVCNFNIDEILDDENDDGGGDDGDDDNAIHPMLTKEQQDINKSIRMSLSATPARHFSSSSSFSLPQEFVRINRNKRGSIVVSWHNKQFDNYWVDLAAVSNRGTYTVQEFCPVSKAYKMFTSLGLRHIVVLGGTSGGEVVGVLTRASFLQSNIDGEL